MGLVNFACHGTIFYKATQRKQTQEFVPDRAQINSLLDIIRLGSHPRFSVLSNGTRIP